MQFLYFWKVCKSIRKSTFLFANPVPLTTNIFIVYLVWNHLSVNITDSFCYNLWGLFFRASKTLLASLEEKAFQCECVFCSRETQRANSENKIDILLKKNVSFFRCEVNKLWTGKRLLIYKKTTMRLILRMAKMIPLSHSTCCTNNKYLTLGIMQIHSGALLIRVVIHWFPTL